MTIKLIIFDLDETLVDSSEAMLESFDYAFASISMKVPKEKIMPKIGLPLKKIFELALGEEKKKHADWLVEKYRENYSKVCIKKTKLYPGVKEILEYLRDKSIKMAVATTKHIELTVLLLKGLGIDNYFDMIIGEGDYIREKPDPESIFVIIDKLKAAPEETLMVGDTIYDVEAGKLAGTKTCAVAYGIDSRKELEEYGPDYIIDRIDELKEIAGQA